MGVFAVALGGVVVRILGAEEVEVLTARFTEGGEGHADADPVVIGGGEVDASRGDVAA